jgi:hypothetical protein
MDKRRIRRGGPDVLVSCRVSAAMGLSPRPHPERVVHSAPGSLVARTLYVFSMALPERREARHPRPGVHLVAWRFHSLCLTCGATMALIANPPEQLTGENAGGAEERSGKETEGTLGVEGRNGTDRTSGARRLRRGGLRLTCWRGRRNVNSWVRLWFCY